MSAHQSAAGSSAGRHAPGPDGARSRERILDAAENLLTERGFAGTSIAAVCKASGLPASSIYWYFENKADLAAAVVERATDRWLVDLRASQPGPEAGAEAVTAWIAANIQEMGTELPLFLRLSLLLVLELGHRDPAMTERLRRGRERARAIIDESLAQVFASEGIEIEGELLSQIANLTFAFSDGAFVARLFDPDAIDLTRFPDDLVAAVQAIAVHRGAHS